MRYIARKKVGSVNQRIIQIKATSILGLMIFSTLFIAGNALAAPASGPAAEKANPTLGNEASKWLQYAPQIIDVETLHMSGIGGTFESATIQTDTLHMTGVRPPLGLSQYVAKAIDVEIEGGEDQVSDLVKKVKKVLPLQNNNAMDLWDRMSDEDDFDTEEIQPSRVSKKILTKRVSSPERVESKKTRDAITRSLEEAESATVERDVEKAESAKRTTVKATRTKTLLNVAKKTAELERY